MHLLDERLAYALFCGVDTADQEAVAEAISEIEFQLFPRESDPGAIRVLFKEVAGIFAGDLACFQAMDTPYHDFQHTLQTTLVWAQIAANYQRQAQRMLLSREFFQIGLVAMLLHDVGYLKEEDDEHGTGAKFTYVHERRSCELAHIWLQSKGWNQKDIFAVQHIISCTGPRAAMDTIPFHHRLERIMGQMVCTADYLGQLADPNYLEKIPALFQEFEESDNYRGIPPALRPFSNIQSLYRGTEQFWHQHVLPRLNGECNGLYHLLSRNTMRGPQSAYLAAIEHNLRRVSAHPAGASE
jgi:hypothetical protein